ncbi:uncharacterized protein PV06_05104 [Exophiala oligosperma]|uniref:Major facilitator superfamily (MFS) profile domain-containing protein n=1 Tax=Exophiala oligosperma TaxID=215243 RepID=A0A0D2E8B7_9EURO|nr:uncharacterized protein PV06_05104 [Exophiala oligosperma]KIW44064.1 hypothetical protein PV06_05104 [Exophiala oligosperma]
MEPSEEKPEALDVHVEEAQPKIGRNGVILIPRPSDDPRDPLNWPTSKKILTLVIVCLASFAGLIGPQANLAGYMIQAEVYGTTPLRVAYSLTGAGVALAVGPFLWSPLSKVMGRNVMIFWSMTILAMCNIWAACMNGPNDYAPYMASKVIGSWFASASASISASILVEIFFLHDRGKAFAIWLNCGLMGSCAAGTVSGYIVQNTTWQVQFWYNVGLEFFVALLSLFFLDETRFVRDGDAQEQTPRLGTLSRLAGFLLLKRTVPRKTFRDFLGYAAMPFKAAYSTTAALVGLALMMSITWATAVNTSLALFLQAPVERGGYGFTPAENAAFTFTTWVAVAVSQLYSQLVNDRLPLAICKRRRGVWHPEYRLYPLVLPMGIASITGLAIFGVALRHHWDRIVLAFGMFLIYFADISTISPSSTYVVESIGTEAATEVITVLSFSRLILGVLVPLFLFDWIAAVGVNWVFGTMAFMNAAAFGIVFILMIFGSRLRNLDRVGTQAEDEIKVMLATIVAH